MAVTATRGKAVRAEPIASLYEQGKIRHAGRFDALEDELAGMTTAGYVGQGSPNRADAMVWAMTALFPGVVKGPKKSADVHKVDRALVHMGGMGAGSWM
jgi:phage terminase large subunit-like protein